MPKVRLSRDRLQNIFETIERKPPRIAVLGDAMLDLYLKGDVDRISPEAPVPVVRVRERRYALGGAANVAQNVLATGAQCEIIAAIGRDAVGVQLREMLSEHGAEKRGLVDCDRPTTTKTRILARGQQIVRVDEEVDADLSADEVARVLDAITRAVSEADALILEDYNKGVMVPTVIRAAVDAAMARGIPTVVDPKYRNFFAYAGTTIFKPNRRELESALDATVDLADPKTLPAALARLGAEYLLLTLSEHGMALVGRDGRVDRIPATAREVYDVVGAGDTATAYLAATLAAGATALEAALIANCAAGLEVGKAGAATVSPQEILDAYEAH